MVFNTEIVYKVKKGRKPPKTLDSRLRIWQTETTRALGAIPGPVQYPIRWTSERQRRAFFATKGFGRGIPSKRTGKVAEWDVMVNYAALEEMRSFVFQLRVFLASLDPRKRGQLGSIPGDGVLVSISNQTPYLRYVEGFQQQGFHRDTGWIFAPALIGDAVRELDGIVADTGFV